ncbi:MAG: type II toxin-antitoxin system RelE/ParE family toxin [Burkholderiaceae bacterium]|jgi:proteic killer suppression protein
MIASFKCKETSLLFQGRGSVRWAAIRSVAERKLQMLNRATMVNDLRVPPNNRLELLKGDRKGQYSIRINDQWRICFKFKDGNAFDVEIIDYH